MLYDTFFYHEIEIHSSFYYWTLCLIYTYDFGMVRASGVCKKWNQGVKQSLARRESLSFSGRKMDDDSTARLVRYAYSLKDLDMYTHSLFLWFFFFFPSNPLSFSVLDDKTWSRMFLGNSPLLIFFIIHIFKWWVFNARERKGEFIGNHIEWRNSMGFSY